MINQTEQTTVTSAANLPAWMIEDLFKSGISPERASALGFEPVAPDRYHDLLGIDGHGLSDGYMIPFRDPTTGQPLLTPDGRPFIRVKLHQAGEWTDPLTGQPTNIKYLSPRGGGQHAFIPPEAHAEFKKESQIVFLTEGEKKSICGTINGFPVIGLTGNWGWKDSNGDLLPELNQYAVPGGAWIVIWDSDAANNPDFADSTRALAATLDAHGCSLQSCVLPKLGAKKTGLDDYLLDPAGGVVCLGTWITGNSRVIRPVQRFASGGADEWTTPQPLSHVCEDAPDWPWGAMPKSLAEMGQAVARTMDVAGEMVGLDLLCTVSIAIGNKVEVAIKPDHIQFANIFGMAIVPPAGGKTPVGQATHRPLNQWEQEQRVLWQEKFESWKIKAAVAEGRAAILERDAAREADEQARTALMQGISAERARIGESPPEPRLYVNDATSEALARRMHANGGAIGVLTSEGRKVLAIARGKYAHDGADIDMWLAGHSGRDPIRVDRASGDKPTIMIPNPCLAAYVAVQPDALQQIALNPELTNSGWLGRWLFVLPDHQHSHYPCESVSPVISAEYAGVIQRILVMTRPKDASGASMARMLPMTAEARATWIGLHNQLQEEIQAARRDRIGEAYLHWLGKAAEHIARIALLFRVVRHVSESGVSLDVVDVEDVLAAAAIMACLQAHARRVFGIIAEPTVAARARALWPVLATHRDKLILWRQAELGRDLAAVKARDVARYGWAGVNDTVEAERVLEYLATKGWVRRREFPPKNTVRARDHVCYELHPNPQAIGGVA